MKRSGLWHRICLQDICQDTELIEKFINIIPEEISPEHRKNTNDFSRDRCLPFPKTVTVTLSLTADGADQGVDSKCGRFFRNARRSGLWPDAEAVHRSSVTKARQKIPWEVFRDILRDSVNTAYEIWPEDDRRFLWHGMSVFATDGSKYNLPATKEIRKCFDPDSGLETNGKGHYPQCLVSTVYDVFRRLPVARTVTGNNGSEREEMKNLLPSVPAGSVWMFDRGYPSYETLLFLNDNYSGHWLFRCPGNGTFPAVEKFVKSGKDDDIIYITPSDKFKSRVSISERKKLRPLKVRVIRLDSPDGTVSVLLTDLFGRSRFGCSEIRELYFRRWRVEEYYRDEKVIMGIEKFHSRNVNGILQEFYAAMIMSVISRCLMTVTCLHFLSDRQEVQFKNALITLASEAAFLVPEDPAQALVIFKELLSEIARVKYYRPPQPRPSQPRVNKSPSNKWQNDKRKKSAENA